MKLFDFLLGRRKAQAENRLEFEQLGAKISARLNKKFKYSSMKRMSRSEDDVISITSPDRNLYLPSKLMKVEKNELLFQKTTIGDARNIFPREHFEAVGEALGWNCEIYLSMHGKAPALFKTPKASIWVAPKILEK
jgi:hypothetical protein